MNMRVFLSRLVLSIFIILSVASNGSAIKVDSVPNLAPQLDEGAQVNFTLTIDDLDQRTVDNLTIETNLIEFGNSPIFDFGDLNKYIDSNRYNPVLYLNLSSIPNQKTITVTISGKAPGGVISYPVREKLVLTKFNDGDLKYYEVKNGKDNSLRIQVFKLNIQQKEQFEKTMQQINLDELSPLEQDVRELFDIGFVTEAQKMASDMSNIKLPPGSLMLFNVYNVKSEFSLDLIVIIVFLFGSFIGYVIRSLIGKTSED